MVATTRDDADDGSGAHAAHAPASSEHDEFDKPLAGDGERTSGPRKDIAPVMAAY
jgi:hypothetical protein